MNGSLAMLGVAMGSALLSGINLYAAVATLGLLEHFGLAHLPGDLGLLGRWWVISLAAVLYLIEFVADKVPAVDSLWDAIHTFIRVPAGAVLASAAFAGFEPSVRIAAFLVGGGVAFGAHGAKAATRIGANFSPEPVSNIALSFIEDVLVVGGSFLVAWHPIAMIAIVVAFFGAVAWLFPKILRAVRSRLKRAFTKCCT